MKPYVFVKKASIGTMVTAAFCLVLMGGLYIYSSMRSSADEAQATPDRTVEITPSANSVILGINSIISVDLKLKSAATPSQPTTGINHVALYRTPPGSLLNPINSDAGKQIICDRINRQSEPLVLIYKASCDAQGNCQTVRYAPESAGYVQLFAVAMKSDMGSCSIDKIAGWSTIDSKQFINIAESQTSSGNRIELTLPKKVFKGQPFDISVQTKGTGTPINHVSILLSKDQYVNTNTPENFICQQANLDEEHCQLCLQQQKLTCDANGTCSIASITSQQIGRHRVVGVAVSNTNQCAPGANIVEVVKDQIIETVEAPNLTNPPTESSPNPGQGGSPGSTGSLNTPELTNPTVIESVTDVINKFRWFIYTFIGILAFSSVVYGGFTMMTAGGDDKRVTRAKNAIVYGITAIILVWLATAIIWNVVDAVRDNLVR